MALEALKTTATDVQPPRSAVSELRLLRGFQLIHQNDTIAVPGNVQRLLAFLGLRDRPQHRSIVAGTLWMNTSEAKAASNLRTALWRARQIDSHLVKSTGSYLCIGDRVNIDLDVMIERAGRLATAGALDPDITADCFGEELLPEWFDDWVLLERERVRQLSLHGLEALCVRLCTLGQYGCAIQAGLAAVIFARRTDR